MASFNLIIIYLLFICSPNLNCEKIEANTNSTTSSNACSYIKSRHLAFWHLFICLILIQQKLLLRTNQTETCARVGRPTVGLGLEINSVKGASPKIYVRLN